MSVRLFLFLSPLFFLFFSCKDDEEVTQRQQSVSINGYVQKGPFINGTAITASELSDQLVTTGKNFNTQIIDNKGSFSLKDIELASSYVQLQAQGFYFDEVRGEKSAAQLTLFALADVSNAGSVNVNLLSHLEKDRVVYLMQEEEQNFEAAKQQVQQEILAIFGIEKTNMTASERLDISRDGEDNAILLAISAILQANNSVAELSELLANLITDIREDGTLDSETTAGKLRAQAMSLDLPAIRQHLEARYEEVGVQAVIPNFEQYVDSDGDGILNQDEDDTPNDFTFEPQVDVAIDTTVVSNEVTISGLKEGGDTYAFIKGGALIVNDQPTISDPAQVRNGDVLKLMVQTSHEYGVETVVTLHIGLITKSFSVTTRPNTWQRKADYPTDNYTDVGFTIGNIFYALDVLGNFYQYDIQTNEWSKKERFPGETRSSAVGFSIGGKGYVGLGHSSQHPGTSLVDFWTYDPEANIWTRVANFGGEASHGAISFIVNDRAYVGLGYSGYSFDNNQSDIWEYNPTTDIWTAITSFPAVGRGDALALVNNGKVYIGTGSTDAVSGLSDFWEFDFHDNVWTQKTSLPGGEFYNGTGLTINDYGYISTGPPNGENVVYLYDFSNDTWEIVDKNPSYHLSSAFNINDKAYYLERYDGNLWEFTPPQE